MLRQAKCTCGKLEPSNYDLPFFLDRSAGSGYATEHCKCGYYEIAHRDDPKQRRLNVVKEGWCTGFQPHDEYEFDSFYCGCRGWD